MSKTKKNSAPDIRLEKVTYANVDKILKLRVRKKQDSYVAKNRDSLIEAYLTLAARRAVYPFGIYRGNKPVGFLMIGYDWKIDDEEYETPEVAKGNYMIWRFMVDRKQQKKGYGRAALQLALDFVRTFPAGAAEYCWLSYEPENKVARKLYRSFGFAEQKELPKGWSEIPAILKL